MVSGNTFRPLRHLTRVLSLAAAQVVAAVVEGYLAAGLVFAVLFLPRGAARVDPGIGRSPVAVRLILAPGVVLLWPVLAYQWRRARAGGPSHPEGPS
jgi:hypothetical protein